MNIDPPVADTLKGERAEIELGPTLTIHRYLGYATFVSAMTNGILGLINWSKYTSGETPSNALRYSHRALGYTTAGLAVITSTFGAINFWKLRDREVGRTKRTIHMALSTLATAGFITAAVLAYNSRRELERGTDKTFTQLYNRHRIIALTGFVSTLLTINWIIW
jgi:hypothetical protein